MAFSELTGQLEAKERLGSSLLGEPGHAFLLIGPAGIGKKTLAREFAKGLICSAPTKDGGCGTCPNCIYMREHTHPDYRELLLSKGEKNIKVAEVRSKILADVGIMSQIADRKVYLIDADGLAEEGQNALLKTLEEPPKHVVFLLTVSDDSKLLPTVLSRTVSLRMVPNTEDEVFAILKKKNPDILDEEARLYARFSGGIVGYALDLMETTWLVDAWEDMMDLVLDLPNKSRMELLTHAYESFPQEKEKEHFPEYLTLMSMIFGELATLICDPKAPNLQGESKKDKMLTMISDHGLTIEKIDRCSRHLGEAMKAYRANGNYEILICRMLLALKRSI